MTAVGIVGGAIAGCTVAAELTRAGFDVTVFEQSRSDLRDRGAGIAIPIPTFESLIERDLIDADMPHTQATKHWLIGKSGDARFGHVALTLPLSLTPFKWGDLFENLRQRVPDAAYRRGAEVASVRNVEGGALLTLDDGSEHRFDLVILADGYDSPGRGQVLPEVELDYRGYVLWRGLLPESELAEPDALDDALPRLSLPELHGNAVFYYVPGPRGAGKGNRLVNWACYIPLPTDDLAAFLVDRNGRQHESSLPPGGMRLEEEARLKQLVTPHLPPFYAEICAATPDTFAQPIYTTVLPAYHRGRICVAGDAGAVVPPFSASGVFKAANNSIGLAAALASDSDIDRAIHEWSRTETESSRRLTALGRQMERAFVWEAPDLAAMDADQARHWWDESITFPDDFTYIAEED
ncbi:MAG: FAD-dependent monooxygenase [Dehalococcoidia bacterium]